MKTCLDKGYVILEDAMPAFGNPVDVESRIVRATRVSFDKHLKNHSVESDHKLLTYLIKNKHTSPFEHVVLTFRVKAPLMVANQWVRHRTQSYNFESFRYTEAHDDEYYFPSLWRAQSETNRQGSDGVVYGQVYCSGILNEIIDRSVTAYHALLNEGVAKELARLVLPSYALYTEFYVTANLLNWYRFLQLRLDPHAQWEIRQYAQAVGEYLNEYCPFVHQLFQEHWSLYDEPLLP